MLSSMQAYEQATVSHIVVDRMERMVSASLAQKDRLILA